MSNSVHVLELVKRNNDWQPPVIDVSGIIRSLGDPAGRSRIFTVIRTQPYIDSLYVEYDIDGNASEIRRFVFYDGYVWSVEDEIFFHEHCIKDNGCTYSGEQMAKVYEEYSALHPEWSLKRYHTKALRLLDHIYNCMRRDTAKEMLYKIGLDELAVNIGELDEINLLASKPSELYDGVTIKMLRALNSRYGARLLATKSLREYLKQLNMKFPDLFKQKLNEAQCRYLLYLIQSDLTVGETGRLYGARRGYLSGIWSSGLVNEYIMMERKSESISEIADIDPIFAKYIKDLGDPWDDMTLGLVRKIMLYEREDYNRAIRRSNRKREYDWQERKNGYVVRYPQTALDFCREAVYMQNCLMGYIEPFITGDTTLLFMRKPDDVNMPFITIEIFEGRLLQAYHRFNGNCSIEEADWIRQYCRRHGIDLGVFSFGEFHDELI